MIGGDHRNRAVKQRLPELLIVVPGFDRRVHFHERPQPLVVIDIEEQMVRTNFRRHPIRRSSRSKESRRRSKHADMETDDCDGLTNRWLGGWQSRRLRDHGSWNGRRHPWPGVLLLCLPEPSSRLHNGHKSANSFRQKFFPGQLDHRPVNRRCWSR